MSRIIAVSGSRHQDSWLSGISHLFSLLECAGFQIIVQKRFYDYLCSKHLGLPAGCREVDSPEGAEACISLGGDGTFLRTAQWVGSESVAILGINTGHLGFLAHYSLDDADEIVDSLRERRFIAERRLLLRVECDNMPPQIWPYALNEVAILKEDTSSMITVNTTIDGYFLADYLADGLLISTPTGSTGYNLSVGGPILQPDIDCRLISPIAPHSLTMRPLVVGADSTIEATTTSRAHTYRVSLDGRSFVMKCGSTIRISRAPFAIATLRLPEDNFASTLRQKLHWAVR